MDVYYSMVSSPAVVNWILAQRRGQTEIGNPKVTIDRPTSASPHCTGATSIELAGKANGQAEPVANVGWENLTLNQKGAADGRESWVASAVPLAPDQTNVIVISATIDTDFGRAFGGTTTFSDTFSVFSTPARLGLTL